MSAAWRSLLERLIETAERRDAAPSLVSPTETLSYAQLFDAALELSARLAPARGELVALALPKSHGLVTAWLACWLAGAAFSTLDPSLPEARARDILRRLAPRFVLRASGGAKCGAHAGEELWIDTAASASNPVEGVWSRARALPMPAPDALAYVCWTSGSTGSPKGATLEHRGLPHVIGDQVRAFELDESARCLWLLRPGFDASLSDVFTCLLAGGELHLAPGLDAGFTTEKLLESLKGRQITHVDLPPSLLPRIPVEKLPESVRCVVVGGEAPDPTAASDWARRVRLLNVYGPTECSICTSLLAWEPDFARPYIGEPLSAVKYRIGPADAARGELWIAGAQLMRGYFEAPELDAERFTELNGVRWYRTGDLVERTRRGPVFLGRTDRQLKLRGQLIAPEEVEAVLLGSGACERAHVTLHGERLVALIQGDAKQESRLLTTLRERLPRWMHPARFVFYRHLPETASGKLDGAALLAALDAEAATRASDAPRTLLEVVARRLGRADPQLSYFAQGGDSLGVLEVLCECEALGLEITPEALASERPLGDLESAGEMATTTPADALDRDARACLARIRPVSPQGSNPREVTLMTGATGFLGSKTLLDLLEIEAEQHYVALVRARDAAHARRRLEAACDAHSPGSFRRLGEGRVRCLVGDVALPDLGLSPRESAWLRERTRAVIHGAARVNLVLPYAVLRPTNLLGTAEVLRFCRCADVERLHHASTLSVFSASDRCPTDCSEGLGLDLEAHLSGGYAQSKWAAERLLELAAEDFPRVSCYRFGLITGDSRTAYAPADDWLTRVSRDFAALGAAPDADLAFDLTPVDYAARAWATLILASEPSGYARYHVRNESVSLERWLAALNEAGQSIDQVPTETFRELLSTRGSPAQRADLVLATTRTLNRSRLDARRGLDLFQATGVHFACTEAERLLADRGVRPPGAPQNLLTRYAARMLEDDAEGAHG